jgi:hypothetical protein
LFLVAGSELKFENPPYDRRLFNELPVIFREQGSGTRLVVEKYLEKTAFPSKRKWS